MAVPKYHRFLKSHPRGQKRGGLAESFRLKNSFMKTTKLVSEIEQVICSNASYPQRVREIKYISFDARPGAKTAREMAEGFCKKHDDFIKTSMFKNGKPNPAWRHAEPVREYRTHAKRAENFFSHRHIRGIDRRMYSIYEENNECTIFSCCCLVNKKIQYEHIVLKKYAASGMSMKDYYRYFNETLKPLYELSNEYKAFTEKTGLSSEYFKCETSLFDLQNQGVSENYARVGDAYIIKYEDVSIDWHAYSKGWHNKYGPKRTVEGRYISIFENGKSVDIAVPAWRGNYLIDALASHYRLEPVKVPKNLRGVQLNKYFSVKETRRVCGVIFYELTLMGDVVMYCAAAGGTTFHAETPAELLPGLKRKIRAEKEKAAQTYTAAILHEKYGYCRPGMSAFAAAAGIEYDGEYTISELRDAAKNPADKEAMADVISRYSSELRKIKVIKG
jgi:hypothetical protein